jgi:hypothetical protein
LFYGVRMPSGPAASSPTRDALVEAVFEAKMCVLAEQAEAAAELALTEPWAALAGYVRALVAAQVADPGFAAVMMRPMQGSPLFAEAHERTVTAVVRLVGGVRDAGVVRPDLADSDIYLLASSTAAQVATPGPVPSEVAARRLAELVLDGFRPAG